MRKKLKMELINNYVEVYRMLFVCKFIINNGSEEEIKMAYDSSLEFTSLKEKYEKTFERLKINDTSFLVLKKGLEDGLCTIPNNNYKPLDISKIHEIKAKISEELNETSLKYNLNI